jgi:NADH-quinone oxidoreductase subunit M
MSHGELSSEHRHEGLAVRPIGWHEVASLAPLMALIVVIGVMPGPILGRVRPSVARISAVLGAPIDKRAVVDAHSRERLKVATVVGAGDVKEVAR